MATVLDDPTVIARFDPSGMMRAVGNASDYLLHPFVDEQPPSFSPPYGPVKNLVFGGMGGSASVADVMIDWLTDRLRIPASIVRNRNLPRYVSKESLFVALSYSGETAETLNLYREARSRGCRCIGVGTGGRLAEALRRNRDAFLHVQSSVAPRAALYQMIAACALMIEGVGLSRGLEQEIWRVGRELERLAQRLDSSTPRGSNMAKQLALSIYDHLPMIYALQEMSSVARRFKNQLNENSKIQAKYDLLPEAGHNEVEAWTYKEKGLLPVFIRSSEESTWQSAMVDGFKKTILGRSTASIDVRVQSNSDLGTILAPILVLDYTSVYLAYLNRVDPTPTRMIRLFRKNVV